MAVARVKPIALLLLAALLLAAAAPSNAGILSYGICQTGCNALVVSCYAAAGFTFGTVTAGASLGCAWHDDKRRGEYSHVSNVCCCSPRTIG